MQAVFALLDWRGILDRVTPPNPDQVVLVTQGTVVTWPYYALGAVLALIYLKGAKP